MRIRRLAATFGRAATGALRWAAAGVRRGLIRARNRSHVVDDLRRRYVFGALNRRQFDEAVKKLGRLKRTTSFRRRVK